MSTDDVHGILAEIATQPCEQWRVLLEHQFPDRPAIVEQGLLWLRADEEKLEDETAAPSLGTSGNDRYELTLRLASGTTASVWRAHDRKLGRNVAVKVFHASSDADTSLELMEARAACDVISDYVVRVLDVHDGVRPYIVMELVAEHDADRDELAIGVSAASARPRSVEEAARWVMEVARGVRDAHLRNVFHRDLKPHNVLITPISRHARIADFGLALSAANDQIGRSSLLIKTGPHGPVSIAGTPEYMAPEQARGLPINLDPLDNDERQTLVGIDVWGLGALAYDLLAGRPPWLANRSTDEEPWEVAASGAVSPPLDRMPDGERIPASLRRVVEKAMSAAPEQRYSSAGQIASELEAFLARRPTSLDRTLALRAMLWSRRNPQLTITAVVALILAAVTLVAYASVRHLRDERIALTAEMSQQQQDEAALQTRNVQIRGELGKTEAQLKTEGEELTLLESALADEKKVYGALLAAKEKALHDATTATRELVDELGSVRTDRRTAELGESMYRKFWEAARADADRAVKDRDQAQQERNTARTERDGLKKERDGATAERDQARIERDQATRDVARLTAELTTATAKATVSDAATAVVDAGANSPDPTDAN
ncbi:MAG: protein kinase [Kofleriaceae bacterium]